MKRSLAAVYSVLLTVLLVFGVTGPVRADDYDFAVDASAVATGSVPSVLTWTVTVASIGGEMGQFAAQEGTVEFTAPNSISLVLSSDCDVDGRDVSCYWLIGDNDVAEFEVVGLVSLTALGDITVTPTFTANGPREDSNAANDSSPVSCTAVTSLLVLC